MDRSTPTLRDSAQSAAGESAATQSAATLSAAGESAAGESAAGGAATSAPLVPVLTLLLAQELLAGVCAEARRRGVAMGVAVVDAGGNLITGVRMDGAQLVALPLATDKAFTAVAFDAPTENWAASTAPGGSDWGLTTTLGGRLVVFAGGLPLHVDGHLVGGLGVSGAAASVDRACAEAGLVSAGLQAAEPTGGRL